MLVDFDVRGQHRMDFFTEEWVIMDSYFDDSIKLKCLDGFVS